jgi:hypothetical protein
MRSSWTRMGQRSPPRLARPDPTVGVVGNFVGNWEPSYVRSGLPTRVRDGARTRDLPDHNRGLYRLSYSHHAPLGALAV